MKKLLVLLLISAMPLVGCKKNTDPESYKQVANFDAYVTPETYNPAQEAINTQETFVLDSTSQYGSSEKHQLHRDLTTDYFYEYRKSQDASLHENKALYYKAGSQGQYYYLDVVHSPDNCFIRYDDAANLEYDYILEDTRVTAQTLLHALDDPDWYISGDFDIVSRKYYVGKTTLKLIVSGEDKNEKMTAIYDKETLFPKSLKYSYIGEYGITRYEEKLSYNDNFTRLDAQDIDFPYIY